MTALDEQTTITTPEPGSEPEPALAQTAGREYVVLYLAMNPDEDPRNDHWVEVDHYTAVSGDEAIKKAALAQAVDPDVDTDGDLTYVAVPVRSFQPVELTARVEPKIEFKGR